ncbi:MAG: Sec-independent protein translocase protein TatB [Proteobacteria bacterium]|jgi:sec-independent protein translocase protein TatB|nr:Sec-independent protein translocase protein TatB [Pseudomonadota bacterium]MDA0971064.1 Sec-independent protein translocase protein TatB [Pseudomonadota bacterium]MDA0995694.1 Sec-independent protein translocase protein TatB [Pseudomonadota bacterium]
MPQIGWSELLVIAIIAILVIGPKDLPIIMKKFGSWIKTIKSYTSNFQNSLENISDVETIDIAEEDNKKKRKTKKNKLDS